MAISPTDYTKYSKQCMMLSTLVSGSVQNKVAGLYALALSAYSADADFKSLFFCDDLVSWVDAENKPVVVGLCAANSDNYNHHASGRLSYLRVTRGGNDYFVMNDAGLNTMPHAYFPSNAIKAHYCNYIKVLCNVLGAYYIGGNSFQVHIYKNGTWVHSQYVMINGSTTVAAQYSGNNLPVLFEEISGLAEGDEITLVIAATNAEGTYTQPTMLTTTLLPSMYFIQVYRWAAIPASNIDPTTGTPYVMQVRQDMYSSDPQNPANDGIFYTLFSAGEVIVSSQDELQGCSGSASTADIENMTTLDAGYYYFGVPSTWQGSTLYYVQIGRNASQAEVLHRYANQYNPGPVYTVTLSWEGNHNTATGIYTVILKATINGTYNSLTLSTKIYSPAAFDIQGNPLGTLVAQPSVAVTSSTVILWQTTTTDSTASYMTWQTTGSTAPQSTPTEVAVHVIDLPDNT